MYDIDRKTASKLLKVSMRTVDRYIVAKKLSTEKRDGHIWLNKKEILKLRGSKRVDSSPSVSTPKMSIDNLAVDNVDTSIDNVHIVSTVDHEKTKSRRQNQEDLVFKNLYEELREDLKIKQDRLEGANYRVGQLEALLKDSIPRLDYQRALEAERASKDQLYQHLEIGKAKIEQLGYKLKEEKTDKKIYLILLFIILLLQPLWLLLSLR